MFLQSSEINEVGKEKLNSFDFNSKVTLFNESLVLTALISELEAAYTKVKVVNFDKQLEKLGPIDSLEKYNISNLIQLQKDE